MIVTLSGITGVGKSYFKNCIIQDLKFKNMAIVTTREKREQEINGIDKYFVTLEQFENLKKDKNILVDFTFLGNEYAYKKEDLLSKENSVTELHYNTIYEFKKISNNILSFYIIPKDITLAKNELYKRKLSKEIEQSRIKEIEQQLDEFKNNKKLQKQFDYIIYNDYTDKTKKEIMYIIKKMKEGNCYAQKSNCRKLENE